MIEIPEKREAAVSSFIRLLDIMDRLRSECPWDKEQTTESLRPLTIEETYELSDAILKRDSFNISKELGDLMLHIVFYSKIGSEQGTFDITDVIGRLCDKLVYRHPHVFSETEVAGTKDVIQNWEQLKRGEKDGNKSLLSGVPDSLPSLVKAYRIQDKARAVGFDWEERNQVWEKVKEELAEFEAEMKKLGKSETVEDNMEGGDGTPAEQEFGDLLFSLVNAARLYNINPDTALEMTNRKFIKRFNYIENRTIKQGRSLKEMSLAEMDLIWEEAKKNV
jgi:MazG family protein